MRPLGDAWDRLMAENTATWGATMALVNQAMTIREMREDSHARVVAYKILLAQADEWAAP